jgi:hypothetical protein
MALAKILLFSRILHVSKDGDSDDMMTMIRIIIILLVTMMIDRYRDVDHSRPMPKWTSVQYHAVRTPRDDFQL